MELKVYHNENLSSWATIVEAVFDKYHKKIWYPQNSFQIMTSGENFFEKRNLLGEKFLCFFLVGKKFLGIIFVGKTIFIGKKIQESDEID